MPVFVNYYPEKADFAGQPQSVHAVRGGSVYTARLASHLRSHDVNIINFPWKPRKWLPEQLNKYLTFPYSQLASFKASQLLHLPGPFNPACLRFPGKVVTTFHDQVNVDFYTRPTKGQVLLRLLESLTAAKTDYVIAPSQFSAERTLARFPKFHGKVHVVYPGIDDVFFEKRSPMERDRVLHKLSLPHTTPFLLYVGAISAHKNYKSVIATYRQIRQTHPRMKLVMIGNIRAHREFPRLLETLADAGLSLDTDVIISNQALSNPELSALYQAASIFLFPSLYEGWGIVVGEALASGTPAVISDIPVFQECFSGGALMVNPHRVEEIVSGINAMLNQPALRERYRERGYELVRERTWQNTVAETVRVYRHYLDKGRMQASSPLSIG